MPPRYDLGISIPNPTKHCDTMLRRYGKFPNTPLDAMCHDCFLVHRHRHRPKAISLWTCLCISVTCTRRFSTSPTLLPIATLHAPLHTCMQHNAALPQGHVPLELRARLPGKLQEIVQNSHPLTVVATLTAVSHSSALRYIDQIAHSHESLQRTQVLRLMTAQSNLPVREFVKATAGVCAYFPTNIKS